MSSRQQDITHLLIRHGRIVDEQGRYTGCLCGALGARMDHYKHLAALIDDLMGVSA